MPFQPVHVTPVDFHEFEVVWIQFDDFPGSEFLVKVREFPFQFVISLAHPLRHGSITFDLLKDAKDFGVNVSSARFTLATFSLEIPTSEWVDCLPRHHGKCLLRDSEGADGDTQ